MKRNPYLPLLAVPLVLTLAACGGGDPSAPAADSQASADSLGPDQAALAISDSQRIAAATATAQSSTNNCSQIKPFYWEIGDKDGRKAYGSVNSPTSTTTYSATLPMTIASASKWIYGAFVAERQLGALTDTDRKFLSMRAGYTSLSSCSRGQTVDGCLASGTNGVYTPANDGVFDYDGGHMEQHASMIGLGSMTSQTLSSAVMSQLGSDIKVIYTSPQLAGGIATSADTYARFLRKVLRNELKMGSLLGTGAVCTNPLTCSTAKFAPLPPSESWHYSVAHWVEDDPEVGDGAFSSPGAFGFYPWIDAGKTTYGVVARVMQQGAMGSVKCGRDIRKAWATGTAL